ncbi:MAG: tyrosine--tRNA ligase [Candidatus Abawacabacteria bacterium RBG_16_42_10]|uniref:Tyrosine--tRNA ligase n=1 Tax=Candidatus Abawacabacteria bacterium RBG_16_42_10 TaxID=1817814 RepID=A0A1F4XLI0_9BACT|nr:MAG: tyrosine--tRNA ligase [Candidatus Abawacabacteria bacterium RBG_16_42_10]
MAKLTDTQIAELLSRGTAEVIVYEDLKKKLLSGKKLRIKLGIDPTGSDLHIGHAVVLRKLRQFQDLGHHVILLVGNFTGKIGDPTDKNETRKQLTDEEVAANLQNYLIQAGKILKLDKLEVVYNADWLSHMSFEEVVGLAANFTVQQMLERDMFEKRMKEGKPIHLHEFFYPLMQGYDSVVLRADLELGGTDQKFNCLAGRVLQRAHNEEPQNVLITPILEGLDGKEKMSKSLNNYIGIMEPPEEQYGKVMSIQDELILRYFELATDVPLEEIRHIGEDLEAGTNPRDVKMRLAREIVGMYHDKEAAQMAEKHFIQLFQKKEIPDEIPVYKLGAKEINLIEAIFQSGIEGSKSQIKRLIEQGGVKLNQETIKDKDYAFIPGKKPIIVQVGKRKFIQFVAE